MNETSPSGCSFWLHTVGSGRHLIEIHWSHLSHWVIRLKLHTTNYINPFSFSQTMQGNSALCGAQMFEQFVFKGFKYLSLNTIFGQTRSQIYESPLNFTLTSTQISGSSHRNYYNCLRGVDPNGFMFHVFICSLICLCKWIHITLSVGGRWIH